MLGKLFVGAFVLGAAVALAVVAGLGFALYGLTGSGAQAATPALVPFPADYSPPPGHTPPPETPFAGNVPLSVQLPVPYTSQAPTGNWGSHFYQESCEEAAITMVRAYLQGNHSSDLDPHQADAELHALVQWEQDHWGDGFADLPLARMGELMKGYYGFSYKVMDANRDSLRQQMALGRPVMVAVMTHGLGNANYPGFHSNNEQPNWSVYHIVVVKGYDASTVTLNDPGVGNGKGYRLSYDQLFYAIDDVRLRDPAIGMVGRPMLVAAPSA